MEGSASDQETPSSKPALRVLFLEDREADWELAERELRKNGLTFSNRRVETEEAFQNALHEFCPDLIIADYSLPQFNASRAFEIIQQVRTDMPFILFSGSVTEAVLVNFLQGGMKYYVKKENVNRLGLVVRQALKEQTERQ